MNMIPEPQFTTSNYASGSPRYYITLSNGDTLWGYSPQAGVSSGSTFAWAVNNGNTYESWGDVQQAEGTETVTGAFVILTSIKRLEASALPSFSSRLRA